MVDYEVMETEEGPRIKLPSGEIIDYIGRFGEVFDVIPDMVPFAHRGYDPWRSAAEIKRVFEEAHPTCRELPAKNIAERFADEDVEFKNWQAQIDGDVYLFAGTWPVEWKGSHREYANPNYVHEDARPRPPEDEHEEWIERHQSIATPSYQVCNHLGIGREALFFDHDYASGDELIDGYIRRLNTVALSLDWGTSIEDIAYVEGVAESAVERWASQAEIDLPIPDPTVTPAFHVK